jgi:HAMP domain-containing protein
VWDENADPFTAAVRGTMSTLRRKARGAAGDRDAARRRLPDRRRRVSRLSLRVRLATLIGLMLALCGVALLAISYGLVSSNLSAPLPSKPGSPSSTLATSRAQQDTPRAAGTAHVVRIPPSGPPARPANAAAIAAIGTKGAAQNALRRRTLDQLVTQYLAVLAGVVLVAVALGWLLAGRLLRSVRRITRVAERVTGRNLNERIGLEGPRDELRELADAFDGMLARLDGVFRAQRRFVADASHELRTPLTAMRAEVEVLAADPHAAAADVEAATLVLRRQLARSEELIEALLALARSEPELLVPEDMDLAQIARQALQDAGVRVTGHRLRFDHQLAPAVVHGDRRLLTLLVGSLLDTPSNTTTTVAGSGFGQPSMPTALCSRSITAAISWPPRRCRSSHRLFAAEAGHASVTGTGWDSQSCKRSLAHTRAQ